MTELRKPEFVLPPNVKGGPHIGLDIEIGHDAASGRRDVHLRFVALTPDGHVDPEEETLFYVTPDRHRAKQIATEILRVADFHRRAEEKA